MNYQEIKKALGLKVDSGNFEVYSPVDGAVIQYIEFPTKPLPVFDFGTHCVKVLFLPYPVPQGWRVVRLPRRGADQQALVWCRALRGMRSGSRELLYAAMRSENALGGGWRGTGQVGAKALRIRAGMQTGAASLSRARRLTPRRGADLGFEDLLIPRELSRSRWRRCRSRLIVFRTGR